MQGFFVLLFVGGLVLLVVWANEQEVKAERRRRKERELRRRPISSNIKSGQTPSKKKSVEPREKKKSLTTKERKSDVKTFYLVGKFENITRSEAKELIERSGGIVSSSVTEETDYLVVGDNPESKEEYDQIIERGGWGGCISSENEADLIARFAPRPQKPDPLIRKREEVLSRYYFHPKQYLPGGGLMSDAVSLFEKPTTFYIVKIKVPMKDGTTTNVHKAGVCVGKVIGGRYTKKAPIEVCVEISNLHRSVARVVEGKMLLIMKKVPWNPTQYPDLLLEEVELQAKWNVEWGELNLKKGKTPDWSEGMKKKREVLYDRYFKDKGIIQPKFPKTWNKKYGPTEWGMWTGTQDELKRTVDQLLSIANEYFVPNRLECSDSLSELYWNWTKSKYRPTQE